MLGDILQRRISNRQIQPNSLQELADALFDEWSRIPQVEFQTRIRSFQNRCRELFVREVDILDINV